MSDKRKGKGGGSGGGGGKKFEKPKPRIKDTFKGNQYKGESSTTNNIFEENEEKEEEKPEPERDLSTFFNRIFTLPPLTQSNEFNFKIVRPMKCTLEYLTNSDGSAKLYQGDTCVLAAAYGPTEVRLSKELPHKGVVDVIFRPKVTGASNLTSNLGDTIMEERAFEGYLISALETALYLENEPGRGFNFIVHEYQNDGCLLSTCFNAAFLSLLDAGCPARFMIASVTILVGKEEKKIIIDPSKQQIDQGYSGLLTFTFNNSHELLFFKLEGRASEKSIRVSLKQALKAVDEIFEFYHELMLSKYNYAFDRINKTELCLRKGEEYLNVKKEEAMSMSEGEGDDDEYEDLSDSSSDSQLGSGSEEEDVKDVKIKKEEPESEDSVIEVSD